MSEPKNKNSMPSFTRGTLQHLKKALTEGKVTPPAFHFLTEENKKCLAFVDIDGVIYEINLNRIEKIESQLEGLVDPETGKAVNVVTYVSDTIKPVENQVTNVSTQVENIQKNGATIMLTSDGGDE